MSLPDAEFRTDDLRKVALLAARVSESESRSMPSTWRSLCATQVFAKFAIHTATAVRLLPDEQHRTVDVSALAALARIVIECHDALIYFTQKGLSPEEQEFRRELYMFHSSFEAVEILERFGFQPDHESAQWQDVFLRGSEHSLSSLPYFQALPSKEQKMLLSGRKAYYWRGSRPKPAFVKERHESALFKLLSNHVHSFPLGASLRFGGSEAPFGQLYTAFFAVEALVMYSASTLSAFIGFRWKVGRVLASEEKSYLKMLLRDRKLEHWLSAAGAK